MTVIDSKGGWEGRGSAQMAAIPMGPARACGPVIANMAKQSVSCVNPAHVCDTSHSLRGILVGPLQVVDQKRSLQGG